MIHIHAPKGPCRTLCGMPCDIEPVAYLDHSEATCPECIEGDTQ